MYSPLNSYDNADPETSPAEGIVLVPDFGESVQLPGGHGRREAPCDCRDCDFIEADRERDQEEGRSKSRPS